MSLYNPYLINGSYAESPIFPVSLYEALFGKRSSSPSTPAQNVADEAARLVKDGQDISAIQDAIAGVERERRAGAEKAVIGALDVAALGTPKVRRFRLALSVKNDGVKVIEGVEFPDERTNKDAEPWRSYVYLGPLPDSLPFSTRGYTSMKALRKHLDDSKIVYRIAFVD